MTAVYMAAERVLSRFGGIPKRAGFWLLDSWRQYFVAMSISYLVTKPTTRSEALFVGTRHRDYLKDTIVRLWDMGLMEGAYVLDFCAPRKNPEELGFGGVATVVNLREGEEDRAAGLLKAARSHLVMVVGADLENPRLREAVENALDIGTPKLVVAADDAPREVREMFPWVVDTDWLVRFFRVYRNQNNSIQEVS